MIYPRTHAYGQLKGKKDKRYAVFLAYMGDPSGKPRYVLEFCNKYVGDFQNLADATLRAIGHHNELMGAYIFVNEPATQPKGN